MIKIFKMLLLATVLTIVFTACNNIPVESQEASDTVCEHMGGVATCLNQAICELCGEFYGEKEDHIYVEILAVASTCSSEGLTAGIQCSECGAILVAQEKIEKLDHDMYEVVEKLPTCTTDGYSVHYACKNCDYVEGKEILSASHSFVEIEGKAATCTEDGYTAYKMCENCDYTEGKEITKTTHIDDNEDYECDTCKKLLLPEANSTLTVAQALKVAMAMDNTYTTVKYYITGTITSVTDATWGNFYLTDANGDEMLIYGLYSSDGKTQYGNLTSKPVKGDEITVYTVLGCYNGTPQGKNAWIDEFISHEHVWADATCKAPKTCSVCEGTEGAPIDHVYVDGVCTGCGKEEGAAALSNATLSFANKAQRTEFSSSKQVWEQNGVKVTNNKSSSTNAVADYASPARFYAGSNLVVEGAGMTKIVFDCNSGSYATALKNSIGTQAGVTVTVSSDKVTVTFDSPVDSFTVKSFTAQVRMDSITVNP